MKLLASAELHPRCIVTSAYFFFFEEDFLAADFDFEADLPAFFLAAMRFTSDQGLYHAVRTKFYFGFGDKHSRIVVLFLFLLIKIAIKNIRNFPVHIKARSRKFSERWAAKSNLRQ